MVDALTAVAISALAAAFALQLLARCASDIRVAHSRMAATRLAEQLYEEARVQRADELLKLTNGRQGGLAWTRTASPTREGRPGVTREAIPLRVIITVTENGVKRLSLEAIVQPAPAAADATEAAASRSRKS